MNAVVRSIHEKIKQHLLHHTLNLKKIITLIILLLKPTILQLSTNFGKVTKSKVGIAKEE